MTAPARRGLPKGASASGGGGADTSALTSGRKFVESVIIAVVTSTGVFLVGSVYTDAYYGRMSIDANALDLAPPFIALQAVHALQSLLVYPVALLLLHLLDQFITSHLPRARSWLARQVERSGRVAILAINGLIVLPLIVAAVSAGSDRALVQTMSALSEVVSLMQAVGLALLIYVLWLSLAQRTFLFAELRQRRIVPVVLLSAIVLFGALVNTAERARTNAERLMTGSSDTSLGVNFIMANGAVPLPDAQLILVAVRNGHYFVVERQPDPPSRTPRAFFVPFRSIEAVDVERINPAPPSDEGVIISVDWPTTFPTP